MKSCRYSRFTNKRNEIRSQALYLRASGWVFVWRVPAVFSFEGFPKWKVQLEARWTHFQISSLSCSTTRTRSPELSPQSGPRIGGGISWEQQREPASPRGWTGAGWAVPRPRGARGPADCANAWEDATPPRPICASCESWNEARRRGSRRREGLGGKAIDSHSLFARLPKPPEGRTQLVCDQLEAPVQFSCSVVFDSSRPHGLQHARPPCPSPTPRVHSNSCPSNPWCHPTISSSVVPLSSHLQSLPASGSFQMSQFFPSGGPSIGVSASTSALPMNIQDWFPLGWTGWISLQSQGQRPL